MTCAEVMTPSPTCCNPNQTVVEAAELMKREDVGLVPIVGDNNRKLIGVITDRDIAVNVVAKGKDTRSTTVGQVMTTDPVSCRPEDPIEKVMELMSTRQIRRVPIVDGSGDVVGIVSQADIATRVAKPKETGKVVEAISEPAAT